MSKKIIASITDESVKPDITRRRKQREYSKDHRVPSTLNIHCSVLQYNRFLRIWRRQTVLCRIQGISITYECQKSVAYIHLNCPEKQARGIRRMFTVHGFFGKEGFTSYEPARYK